MLDIFSGLRLVVKRRSINIDNAIFRCHWFFTSTLLVSFSLIITARQYVGQPIECHSVDKLPDSLLNSYCWVQSTFSIPQACNNQQFGVDVPYPCIDNTRGREIKLYAYYQWVGIVLFVQGLLFHCPYYLWKLWENGLIRAITGGLRVAVLNEQERAKKKEIVVDYLHDHLGCHNRYAFKYFLCEFICLINLIGQIWATNKFFDGQFLRYGLDVMQYSSTSLSSQFAQQSPPEAGNNNNNNNNDPQRGLGQLSANVTAMASSRLAKSTTRLPRELHEVDPMTYVFPRMTKCTYYDFGSSGDVQKHDALCLLPLNIINEKIYIALWFWFIILAILTVLVIVYRLLAITSESVRCKGLISRCKLSNEHDIRVICRYCDVGDWFLFYMVAENLDPLIMREIVSSIAGKICESLELKNELKLLQQQQQIDDCNREPAEKSRFRLFLDHDRDAGAPVGGTTLSRQHSSSGAPEPLAEPSDSLLGSRRSSFADQMPLVRKIRKRLYGKRLWSVDLSPSDLRRQLSCAGIGDNFNQQHNHHQQHYHHPPLASAFRNTDRATGLPMSANEAPQAANISFQFASAPPASQMPLNSASPLILRAKALQRRGSLTRKSSSVSSGIYSNSTDSFVMEMATISGSPSRLDGDLASPPATITGHHHQERSP